MSKILVLDVYASLKIALILANSRPRYEMPPYAAFHT